MILSASRRTDIPCYYSEWFLNRLKAGFVLVPNPRNANLLSRVALSPEIVDCIVFWTKNPAPMEEKLPLIHRMGYQYYFTFSVTAYDAELEPNLPAKAAVLETFRRFSEKLGPEAVDWRFDPILRERDFSAERIAGQFETLCRKLRAYTNRCIISFADAYAHKKNNEFIMSRREILETARAIAAVAAEYHLPLYSCAEPIDLSAMGIRHSSCIDREKIERIIGVPIQVKKDAGQRPACGCIESVDVGVYDTCGNGCVYCYAVTNLKTVEKRLQNLDPHAPLLTGQLKGTERITDRTTVSQKINQLSFFESVDR